MTIQVTMSQKKQTAGAVMFQEVDSEGNELKIGKGAIIGQSYFRKVYEDGPDMGEAVEIDGVPVTDVATITVTVSKYKATVKAPTPKATVAAKATHTLIKATPGKLPLA